MGEMADTDAGRMRLEAYEGRLNRAIAERHDDALGSADPPRDAPDGPSEGDHPDAGGNDPGDGAVHQGYSAEPTLRNALS